MKPITLNEFVKKASKDKEFKLFYEKELLINSIAQTIHEMRINAGLTQKQLAEKAGTTQPVIARIESGADARIPSLDLLARLSIAANTKISINLGDIA